MPEEIIEDAVLRFAQRERGRACKDITLDSDLHGDLRLDGADAEEFLRRFSVEFRVDLSGFPFDEYFGPEAFDPVGAIIRRIRRGRPLSRITLRDLVGAARRGRF